MGTDPSQTCQGDSGGPLVHKNKLFGVTSYGFPPCVNGYPTVFSSAAHFRENGWLADNSDYVESEADLEETVCDLASGRANYYGSTSKSMTTESSKTLEIDMNLKKTDYVT